MHAYIHLSSPNVHEIRGWRLEAPETRKYDKDIAKIQRTVSQSHLIELLGVWLPSFVCFVTLVNQES